LSCARKLGRGRRQDDPNDSGFRALLAAHAPRAPVAKLGRHSFVVRMVNFGCSNLLRVAGKLAMLARRRKP
jgi:hypothetical protein